MPTLFQVPHWGITYPRKTYIKEKLIRYRLFWGIVPGFEAATFITKLYAK
jgi:hypothetical protein